MGHNGFHRFLLVERERCIADDATPVTCRVARVGLIDQLDGEAAPLCQLHQTVDRRRAASLLVRDVLALRKNRRYRPGIQVHGIAVGVKMRQITTDDDQGLIPAP